MRGLSHYLKCLTPALIFESRRYLAAHARLPNLLRPKRFTEKILLRKLYDRNPLFVPCSDKHAVRSYVADRIGTGNLVPLLAVTEDPGDLLDLATWRMTAMKPNHGSEMVLINSDEEPSLDQKRHQVQRFRGWLKWDYSKRHGEWQYAHIPRKLVVERNVAEPGVEPLEWKFHCFRQPDGAVAILLQVIGDRFMSKRMAFYLDGVEVHRSGDGSDDALPPFIDDADRLLLAEAREKSVVLCRDFDYVRVDWMIAAGRLYFSELTFTPGAGLSPSFGPALDLRAGQLWTRKAGGDKWSGLDERPASQVAARSRSVVQEPAQQQESNSDARVLSQDP